MDDSAAVRLVERVGDFDGDLDCLVGGESLARQASVEGFAFEVLHDEEIDVALRTYIVENANIGMLQA